MRSHVCCQVHRALVQVGQEVPWRDLKCEANTDELEQLLCKKSACRIVVGKRAEGGGWKKPWWGGTLGFLIQDASNCVLLGLHHSMAGSLTNFSCYERHKHMSETGAVYVLCSWVPGEEVFKTKVLSDLYMYWQFCSTWMWLGVWFYVLSQEYDMRDSCGAGCSSVLPFVPLSAQSWNLWLFCERLQSPRVFQDEGYSIMGSVVLHFVVKRVNLQNQGSSEQGKLCGCGYHPWRRSRPVWMRLWATWSSDWCSYPWLGSWT